MTTKERAARFAALRKDLEILEIENRDWLVLRIVELQDDLRRTDIKALQNHLAELIEAVAEDE